MKKVSLSVKEDVNLGSTNFYNKVSVKRVLLCFNGFTTNKKHDLLIFKNFFDRHNINKNYDVKLVWLYDVGNTKSYNEKSMYKRAYDATKKELDKGNIVYLLGYSFSANITARLAVEFPSIEKICLISPTTYLIKTSLLFSYIQFAFKNLKFRLKYKNRANKFLKKTKIDGVVKLTYEIAKSIAKNRRYLKKVDCKVFMTKGGSDNLSITDTFNYIAKKSKNAIIISKIYPNRGHTMIMAIESGRLTFQDVLSFIFHMSFNDELLVDERNYDIDFNS